MKNIPQKQSFKALKNEFNQDFDKVFTFLQAHVPVHKLWKKASYQRHAGTCCLELFMISLYKIIYSPSESVCGFFAQTLQKHKNQNHSKDSYYRFMKNPKINWRRVLWSLNTILIKALPKQDQDNEKTFDERFQKMSFLILDDSIIPKSGRKIEGVSCVHDHASGSSKSSRFGYKFLGLCYVKQSLCSIVDFALVGEKKIEGVKPKSKKRDKKSFGFKRLKELKKKKTVLAEELLRRARKFGLRANYVLFDSWFFSLSLAKSITDGVHGTKFLGGLKRGRRKFTDADGEELNLEELHKKNSDKVKRNRSFKAKYIEMDCELPGFGQVKIFASKYNKSRKWVYLITNDLDLSYEQALKIYTVRWNIEVCFKELKQYLGVGKNQASDFDAQIAHMTCACMMHAIIRFYQAFHQEQTFGEIFTEFSETIERSQNLNQYWDEFEQIIGFIAEILGGADKITVAELFQSAEYQGLRGLIQENLQLYLSFGTTVIKHESVENAKVA